MENLIQSTTKLALHVVSAYAKPDAVAIDATCGNGHDALALLEMKPAPMKLFAFDIQTQAIEATEGLLMQHFELKRDADDRLTSKSGNASACIVSLSYEHDCGETSVYLILDSHENMAEYTSSADIILFNLGYLPSGDKSITTTPTSTMSAVTSALEILNEGGILCISMYSGHDTGAIEKAELLAFASKLDPRIYHVAYINIANQPNNPPESLLITRKKR